MRESLIDAGRQAESGHVIRDQEFERDGRLYYDEKYFQQLRSERPVTVYTKKGAARVWQKLKASARNEAS